MVGVFLCIMKKRLGEKNIKKYLVVINFLITFAIITPDEGGDLSFKIHKI